MTAALARLATPLNRQSNGWLRAGARWVIAAPVAVTLVEDLGVRQAQNAVDVLGRDIVGIGVDDGQPDSAGCPALRARLLQSARRSPAHRHVPDILGIFADGAVGREPRHPRDVEDAGPGPCRDYLPARVDAALGRKIGVEISTHHVMVEMAQRVPDR